MQVYYKVVGYQSSPCDWGVRDWVVEETREKCGPRVFGTRAEAEAEAARLNRRDSERWARMLNAMR